MKKSVHLARVTAIAAATLLTPRGHAALPPPPPIPAPAHPARPVPDQITLTEGRFQPTVKSLKGYQCPTWFRDAKFGIWSHWGPQAVPMQDGWYARNMYQEGSDAYKYHLAHYGHPAVFGFKDIVQLWHAEKFDPDHLMKLFVEAGAKYFVAQGVHHDNFDNWDSTYHEWNSINYGPHKDIVGLWQAAALKAGVRFGISEHLARSYSWMNLSHGADQDGPFKGVPYDGRNPQYVGLYYPPNDETTMEYPLHPPDWVTRDWFYRMKDLEDKFHPDLLYSDGALPFDDVGRTFLADYYNANMKWNGGQLEAVYNIKDLARHGEYIEGACVQDLERSKLDKIKPEPWQTDTSTGPWFYNPGGQYSATQTIHELVDIVSKNGNLLLNIPQKPDGSLDAAAEQMLVEMGDWMRINGEAIFGTRPWTIFGEGPSSLKKSHFDEATANTASDLRFTCKGTDLYVTVLGLPKKEVVIRSLSSDSPLVQGKISRVSLLGYSGDLQTERTARGLVIPLPELALKSALCFRIAGLTTVANLPPEAVGDFTDRSRFTVFKVDGSVIELPATEAKLQGSMIRLQQEGDADGIGYWSDPTDTASWKLAVVHPGTYQISADMGSPSPDSHFTIQAGSREIDCQSEDTGGWYRYRLVDVGTLTFDAAGPVTLTIKPKSADAWIPINLRAIRLMPVP